MTSCLLFFSACSTPEIKKESPEINEVIAGSKFRIILPEDHRTGYMWQIKQDFDKQVLENTHAVWHGNEKGIYFEFKALREGQTLLTLVNRRYTDTLNVKLFIIKVLAKH